MSYIYLQPKIQTQILAAWTDSNKTSIILHRACDWTLKSDVTSLMEFTWSARPFCLHTLNSHQGWSEKNPSFVDLGAAPGYINDYSSSVCLRPVCLMTIINSVEWFLLYLQYSVQTCGGSVRHLLSRISNLLEPSEVKTLTRHHIFFSQVSYVFALAVFEDFLYATRSDPSKGTSSVELLQIHRFNLTAESTVLASLGNSRGLRVYHKLTQPTGKEHFFRSTCRRASGFSRLCDYSLSSPKGRGFVSFLRFLVCL